jgi:hypothetical protein
MANGNGNGKNGNGKGRGGVRPGSGPKTKYNPLYHPTMIRLAAQLGKVDEEIAKEIGICRKTLYAWKVKYPEVDEALSRGKEIPNKLIEQDAFDCAHGYYYEEELAHFHNGRWHKTIARRYVPKNPTSIIWWQKNRDPENWKERVHVDMSSDKLAEAIEAFREIK